MFVNPLRTALTSLKGRFTGRRKPAPPPPVASKPAFERKENVKFDLASLLPAVEHPPFNKPAQLEASKRNRARERRHRLKKFHKRAAGMNAQYRKRA